MSFAAANWFLCENLKSMMIFKLIRLITFVLIVGTIFSPHNLYSQNKPLSLSFSSYYTVKSLHFSPSLNYQFKLHAFYAGPDFISILKPFGDPVNTFEPRSIGVQLGYNYIFSIKNKWSFLCDFHFSIYPYKTNHYTWFEYSNHTRIIVENSLSFGVNYRLRDRLSVYCTAGLNSYDGFFLLIENSSIACMGGFKYYFSLKKSVQ